MYELIPHQYQFLISDHVHTGLVGGYGCGKTFAGILKCVSKKLQYPGVDVAYYLPTYGLIEDVARGTFEAIMERQKLDYSFNVKHTTYTTPYGKIILRSMDSPSRIVGYEVGYSLIDEADLLPKKKMREAFNRIIGRNRSVLYDGKPNAVDFVSTPEGYNFLYEFFIKEDNDTKKLIKGITLNNPNLPPSYVETLKKTYTEAQLNAYLYGDFVNLENESVYYSFDRHANGTHREVKKGEQIFIGMDFNIGNMSAVIFVCENGKAYAVDELTGVLDTPTMGQILKERYRGHRATVFPDASGQNRKTVGMSDVKYLRSLGFNVTVRNRNPFVKDRITVSNVAFQNKTAFVNYLRCPEFTEALEKQSYKNGEPDKSSGFDHVNDAGTYAIYELEKFTRHEFDGINV